MLRKLSSLVLFFTIILSGSITQASSADSQQKLDELANKLKETGQDAVLVAEVTRQNGQALAMSTINSRDQKWQATSGMDGFMKELMSNAGAKRLAAIEKEYGVIVESFLMDNKGANVSMTNKTSDYWQGDEAKFIKSFNGGKGAVHMGEAKFDKSAQAYVVQISVPVISGDRAIGAITYSVNMDDLK
jgi:hypothetical protein